jgi:hypothetical protein
MGFFLPPFGLPGRTPRLVRRVLVNPVMPLGHGRWWVAGEGFVETW